MKKIIRFFNRLFESEQDRITRLEIERIKPSPIVEVQPPIIESLFDEIKYNQGEYNTNSNLHARIEWRKSFTYNS